MVGDDAVTEGTPRRRAGRPAPPPRDILGGSVRADELPDVARPVAPPPGSPEPESPAADRRSRAVLMPLPWQFAGIVLGAQAAALADGLDRGIVPPPLVPGAVLMEAQLRAAARVLGHES